MAACLIEPSARVSPQHLPFSESSARSYHCGDVACPEPHASSEPWTTYRADCASATSAAPQSCYGSVSSPSCQAMWNPAQVPMLREADAAALFRKLVEVLSEYNAARWMTSASCSHSASNRGEAADGPVSDQLSDEAEDSSNSNSENENGAASSTSPPSPPHTSSLLFGRCLKPCCQPLGFLAPEVLDSEAERSGPFQLQSAERSDTERVEVWILGVILFTLLTGRQPFEGRTQAKVLQRIRSGRVRFPLSLQNLKLSRQAKDLTKWMLSVDPLARPSMREILEHPWFSLFC